MFENYLCINGKKVELTDEQMRQLGITPVESEIAKMSRISKAGEAADISRAEDAGDEGTDLVLEYIYGHLEEFKLIFCCSAGTEYETYFDRLAAKEEHYYKQFAKQFSDGGHPVDDFFIHVHCRNGWQCVYELITHDKSYDEAKEFMANVRAFNYAGWQAVIGIQF